VIGLGAAMPSVELTALQEHDYELLCSWRNSPDFLRLCTQQSGPIALKDFPEELKYCFLRGRHCQSIIRDRRGNPLGTVFSYDYSERNKYCFVTIYLANSKSTGAGVAAALKFCNALFRHFAIHKIYFDVHEHNSMVRSMLQRCGLNIEGQFKGHTRFNGIRYDTFRFALYKDTLDDLTQRLLGATS
jgi:RimJ/RimL family protein N-acetyltransferase